MDVLSKLKTLANVTPNEQVLVQYILNHPEKFLLQKPQEVSDELFVSLATLYRLLEKLDYSGVTQFKVDLATTIKAKTTSSPAVDVNYPIKQSDSYREIVDNLSDLYQQTSLETERMLDYQTLSLATEQIEKAHSTTVFTSSSNIYFAENFSFQMREIGYTVDVPKDEFTQSLHAANMTSNDVAIIVSYGGRSHNLHRIIKILRTNQVKIILITSTQSNPLSKEANLSLYLASIENHYHKVSSFSSRFSLLFLFDLLYSGIFTLNYERNRAYKTTNYQKINEELK